ncbi:MAG: hypothetical protein M3283_03645 [Actinomycetota bacterium]|jgi:hypothetical protein|nr:hypothetical protein [Actinomycetota bacterium]MDQ4083641.1 hypothetical protein [Actinomycetota bacterium]
MTSKGVGEANDDEDDVGKHGDDADVGVAQRAQSREDGAQLNPEGFAGPSW